MFRPLASENRKEGSGQGRIRGKLAAHAELYRRSAQAHRPQLAGGMRLQHQYAVLYIQHRARAQSSCSLESGNAQLRRRQGSVCTPFVLLRLPSSVQTSVPRSQRIRNTCLHITQRAGQVIQPGAFSVFRPMVVTCFLFQVCLCLHYKRQFLYRFSEGGKYV